MRPRQKRIPEPATLDLPETPTALVVEDDVELLQFLQARVEAAGCEVLTATSGDQALARLEQSSASIVITDLNMPQMDGFELCRRIRARTGTGYVYVMLLTIRDGEANVLAGLEAGADDYLSKRTSAEQLTARVRTARRVLALEHSWKAASEQRHPMAITDALTGVYNRGYFVLHLSRELKRAQRVGGDLSIIILDIDHFKKINHVFGHAVGDTILKKLTKHIGQLFKRKTAWCARLSGAEFVIVLQDTDLEAARLRAEFLRERIADVPIETAAGPIAITVSMGMSGIGGAAGVRATSVDGLLERADSNLHASKDAGRNCVTSGPRAQSAVTSINSAAR